jgi:hypothetical protein
VLDEVCAGVTFHVQPGEDPSDASDDPFADVPEPTGLGRFTPFLIVLVLMVLIGYACPPNLWRF